MKVEYVIKLTVNTPALNKKLCSPFIYQLNSVKRELPLKE